MTMTSEFPDIIVKFFWRWFVSLVKFNYWSKFHVTGSWVMRILFYKELTRNPEIRNTPVWVSPNIWTLGPTADTKFGAIVSTKMLLNAAKYQVYLFYCFWVVKGKPTGGGGKITLPLPQITVKSEGYNAFNEETNKIALGSIDDKGMQSIDSIETFNLLSEKEEIKCNNIIK